MGQEAAQAAITPQGAFVSEIMLPHPSVLGPLVHLIEVAIGVSLLLGLLSRFGALLDVAMALNLWLGLGSPPRRVLGAATLLQRRAAGARGIAGHLVTSTERSA